MGNEQSNSPEVAKVEFQNHCNFFFFFTNIITFINADFGGIEKELT